MTLKAFYEQLRQLKEQEWEVSDEARLVRLRRRDVKEWRDYCPITAVALKQVGKRYLTSEWKEAAEAIGLPQEKAFRIVRGADAGHYGIVTPLMRRMRQRLRRALAHLA